MLVDGKFLALQLIVNGRAGPGIRELLPSDLTALDEHIHRCKLGPFRPGVARGLAEEMATAPNQAEHARAAKELQKLRSKARSELGKLRRIQENRLAQLRTPEEPGALPQKEDKGKDSAIAAGSAFPQDVDIPAFATAGLDPCFDSIGLMYHEVDCMREVRKGGFEFLCGGKYHVWVTCGDENGSCNSASDSRILVIGFSITIHRFLKGGADKLPCPTYKPNSGGSSCGLSMTRPQDFVCSLDDLDHAFWSLIFQERARSAFLPGGVAVDPL
ncbi:unnamed protein product [Symbiodinium necroappetens]|uniref:Uncharacterized protein n=1 Tax=Symbiodinium necroappetens TaxID=1628268 RepID=A0A812VM80_9DINO|nr:unnamed protein product [Symbiodinium necroappetens]